MWIKKLLSKILKKFSKDCKKQLELSRERIAQHEAAHGIV
jgi:hypothetical protein